MRLERFFVLLVFGALAGCQTTSFNVFDEQFSNEQDAYVRLNEVLMQSNIDAIIPMVTPIAGKVLVVMPTREKYAWVVERQNPNADQRGKNYLTGVQTQIAAFEEHSARFSNIFREVEFTAANDLSNVKRPRGAYVYQWKFNDGYDSAVLFYDKNKPTAWNVGDEVRKNGELVNKNTIWAWIKQRVKTVERK